MEATSVYCFPCPKNKINTIVWRNQKRNKGKREWIPHSDSQKIKHWNQDGEAEATLNFRLAAWWPSEAGHTGGFSFLGSIYSMSVRPAFSQGQLPSMVDTHLWELKKREAALVGALTSSKSLSFVKRLLDEMDDKKKKKYCLSQPA